MFSLFGFKEFNSVNALEDYALDDSALTASADSRGPIKFKQSGPWVGRYKVRFFDASGNEIKDQSHCKKLTVGRSKTYKIPDNAETIEVKVYASIVFSWIFVDFYQFKVNGDESATNFINVIGKGPAYAAYSEEDHAKGWYLAGYI